MVFGCGTDHGWSTDINPFDQIRVWRFLPLLFKRIEICHYYRDWDDRISRHFFLVALIVQPRQNTAMDLGMQAFNTPP